MNRQEILRCPICNRGIPTTFWRKIATRTRDCLGWIVGNRGGSPKSPEHGFFVEKELRLRSEASAEGYGLVKSRLLDALTLWVQKGWITLPEIKGLLQKLEMEIVDSWAVVVTARAPGYRPVNAGCKMVDVAAWPRAPVKAQYKEVEV